MILVNLLTGEIRTAGRDELLEYVKAVRAGEHWPKDPVTGNLGRHAGVESSTPFWMGDMIQFMFWMDQQGEDPIGRDATRRLYSAGSVIDTIRQNLIDRMGASGESQEPQVSDDES